MNSFPGDLIMPVERRIPSIFNWAWKKKKKLEKKITTKFTLFAFIKIENVVLSATIHHICPLIKWTNTRIQDLVRF